MPDIGMYWQQVRMSRKVTHKPKSKQKTAHPWESEILLGVTAFLVIISFPLSSFLNNQPDSVKSTAAFIAICIFAVIVKFMR